MANPTGNGSLRLTCPLCGGPAAILHPKVSDPLSCQEFAIFRCSHCHSGQTDPLPEDLRPFYGDAYHGQRHGSTAGFCARRRLRILSQLFKNRVTRRLLDVGCGDGTFLLAARANGWQVAGTEMNPRLARAQGLEVHESIDQLPSDALFDCITFWHVLEHLREPTAALQEAAKRLKPSGHLVVAVPNIGGWQASCFGRHWLHLDVPRHVTHFTEAGLDRSLASAGLTPTRRWHQEFEYDVMGWAQSALNAIAPAPNVFFHWLAGKPTPRNRVALAANVIAGTALTMLAVPLVWAGSAARKGGTLIVAARPSQ
jgi:SAM-dependent methyltransferase